MATVELIYNPLIRSYDGMSVHHYYLKITKKHDEIYTMHFDKLRELKKPERIIRKKLYHKLVIGYNLSKSVIIKKKTSGYEISTWEYNYQDYYKEMDRRKLKRKKKTIKLSEYEVKEIIKCIAEFHENPYRYNSANLCLPNIT